jgi:hypothetical protein
MGRRLITIGLVLLAIGIGAAPAHASTVIGSTMLAGPPSTTIFASGTLAMTALPGANTAPGGVVAPSSGVITSWTIRLGASTTGNTIALRVVGGNTAISTGRVYPVPATAGIHSFPERLPIVAGQALAIGVTVNAGMIPLAIVTAGSNSNAWAGAFADGTTRAPDDVSTLELLMQAVLEPDADSDGFGDETQDGCLGEAGPRGGCPLPPEPPAAPIAPDTQIDSGPTGKITKSKATFTFSSPRAGASFECALDDLGFSPCSSPSTFRRLTPGKHRFRVRAISADGLVDASPAEQAFKVKRKRHKPK